jgi:hypothetical protein
MKILCIASLISNIPCADIEGLVDKKGGPEDMYELAGEADIVITCLLQTNETVNTSLGPFPFLLYASFTSSY